MTPPTIRCDPVALDRLAAAIERVFADPAVARVLAPLVALIRRADRAAADTAPAGDGQTGSQAGLEGSPAGEDVRQEVGDTVEFSSRPDASETILAVSGEPFE